MRGCRVSAVEVEERPNERLDPGDVGGRLLLGLEHPLGGGTRVADQARRAPHQADNAVAGSLQSAQQDELDEVAEVQRRRCRVEPAIGRDRSALSLIHI